MGGRNTSRQHVGIILQDRFFEAQDGEYQVAVDPRRAALAYSGSVAEV